MISVHVEEPEKICWEFGTSTSGTAAPSWGLVALMNAGDGTAASTSPIRTFWTAFVRACTDVSEPDKAALLYDGWKGK